MVLKKIFILIIFLFFSTSDAMAVKILEDIGKTLDKAVKKGAEDILKEMEKKEQEETEKTEDKETQIPTESKPVPKKEAAPKKAEESKPVPKKEAAPKKAEQKIGDHITKGDITLLNIDEIKKLHLNKLFEWKSYREDVDYDPLVYLKYFDKTKKELSVQGSGHYEGFVLFYMIFTDLNQYPYDFYTLDLPLKSPMTPFKKSYESPDAGWYCVSFKELELPWSSPDKPNGCGRHHIVWEMMHDDQISVDKNGKFIWLETSVHKRYDYFILGRDNKTNKIYSFEAELKKSPTGQQYYLVGKKNGEIIEYKNEKEGPKHFIHLMVNRIDPDSDEAKKKKAESKEISEEELNFYRGTLGGKDDFKFGMTVDEVKKIISTKCAKDDNVPSPKLMAMGQEAQYNPLAFADDPEQLEEVLGMKNKNLIFPYISKEILGKAFKNIDFRLRGISCFSILGSKPKYTYFGFDKKHHRLSVIYVDTIFTMKSEQEFDDIMIKKRKTLLQALVDKYKLAEPDFKTDIFGLVNNQMGLIESGSIKETFFMYEQTAQVALYVRNIPDDLETMFGGSETSVLSTQEFSIMYLSAMFSYYDMYPLYNSFMKSIVQSETGGGL